MEKSVKNKLNWYKNYLEDYFVDFCELIKDTELLNYFESLGVNYKETYLVSCSDYKTLRKFTVFYLILKYARYQSYSMYDYASDLCNNTSELFDKEVVILYNHKHDSNLGNTENWLLTTVLNKVAVRNRDKQRTLLLTERRLPTLENSGEFVCIELSKVSNKVLVTNTDISGKSKEPTRRD